MISVYSEDERKLVKITPKRKAQDELMGSMQVAFNWHESGHTSDRMTEREKTLVWEQMDKQMARIEKLFGYTVGSWTRGC